MPANIDSHIKTVNLNSSLPVNSQMKRVIKSNCPNGTTPNCIKKSYNIPIAGKQANNWGSINGKICAGPQIKIMLNDSTACGCITNYHGISRCATNSQVNLRGVCQISNNATAKGVWVTSNGHTGTIQNTEAIVLHGSCPNISCHYFLTRCKYSDESGNMTGSGNMSFSAVCNTCN